MYRCIYLFFKRCLKFEMGETDNNKILNDQNNPHITQGYRCPIIFKTKHISIYVIANIHLSCTYVQPQFIPLIILQHWNFIKDRYLARHNAPLSTSFDALVSTYHI